MIRKVLVIFLALMVVALFATPVLAESPKKEYVTATQLGAIAPGPESRDWETEGGIIQHRDNVGSGKVTLNIPSQAPLVGQSSSLVSSSLNTKTMVFVAHLEMKWTFTGGTFEGIDQMKMYVAEGPLREAHMVMHGTGVFEGYVLTLTGETTTPAMNWEGFLLIP